MFDILILNGKVLDGTGNPWFKADVGIRKGKILKIGRLRACKAKTRINAEGKIVSPGFIDIHSHSDFTLLADQKAESKIRQGVTTETIGLCGLSVAPLKRKGSELIKELLSDIMLGVEVDWDWLTLEDYLGKLEEQGISVNVVPLIGHGTIRVSTIGLDDRAPTRAELEEMRRLTMQGMRDGAFGMSSMVQFPPGNYAKTEEMIELCEIVNKHGGFYATHIGAEGGKSIEESIRVAEGAGIPVHILHFASSTLGFGRWGEAEKMLSIVDDARKRGVDMTLDQYPYTAGSGALKFAVPSWALAEGKLTERLKDPELREKMRKEMNPEYLKKNMIALYKGHEELEGKTVEEIAKTRKIDVIDAVFGMLTEDETIIQVGWARKEEDIQTVFKHQAMMVGSDGFALIPYGVLGKGKGHPRSYGCFPKVLSEYVKKLGVISLEDAIRKMTSFPAQRLGLKGRGLLKEGMWADLILFDLDKVTDKATYLDPYQYAEGIDYVIVNGQIVLEEGKHSEKNPGIVLRKNRQ